MDKEEFRKLMLAKWPVYRVDETIVSIETDYEKDHDEDLRSFRYKMMVELSPRLFVERIEDLQNSVAMRPWERQDK